MFIVTIRSLKLTVYCCPFFLILSKESNCPSIFYCALLSIECCVQVIMSQLSGTSALFADISGTMKVYPGTACDLVLIVRIRHVTVN